MPVAAVKAGGIPSVNRGSTMARDAIVAGPSIPCFRTREPFW